MRKIAFTVAELEELIPAFSRATIYRHLKDGKIQSIKIGNKIFITREWIESTFGPIGDKS